MLSSFSRRRIRILFKLILILDPGLHDQRNLRNLPLALFPLANSEIYTIGASIRKFWYFSTWMWICANKFAQINLIVSIRIDF